MDYVDNIMRGYIALSEIGIDSSERLIDTQTISDTVYSLYCENCCSEKRFIYKYAKEYDAGNQIGKFTSCGVIGVFAWLALTTYYGSDIYKLNNERKIQNAIHRETMQKGNYELGCLLNHAINNSLDMCSLLREPIVLNTKDILDYEFSSYLSALQNHLENFMELPHVDVAWKENETIHYNWSQLRNKDVVIPFILGTQKSINVFARIASEICGEDKASCAVGLFITRIKPSLDGKETKIFETADQIPIISESPFISPL